jgi:hypothetical protein
MKLQTQFEGLVKAKYSVHGLKYVTERKRSSTLLLQNIAPSAMRCGGDPLAPPKGCDGIAGFDITGAWRFAFALRLRPSLIDLRSLCRV